MTEAGVGDGFALDEYVAVRHGLPFATKGGTIPKAVNPPGGIMDKLATKENPPGPGHYLKDALEKPFATTAPGGTFSKLVRDKKVADDKGPAVGQYNAVCAQVEPRTKGGLMVRHDRICAFVKMADRAARENAGGPGKYETNTPRKHTPGPNFGPPKTESRIPRKPTSVGPGYYHPVYAQTEKKPPSYSSPKEASGSYMNKFGAKSATPYANYKDMPDSERLDRAGRKKHCKKLLTDRKVTPRRKMGAVAARAYEVESPYEVRAPPSARCRSSTPAPRCESSTPAPRPETRSTCCETPVDMDTRFDTKFNNFMRPTSAGDY